MNINDFVVNRTAQKQENNTDTEFYTVFGMEDYLDDDGNPRQQQEKQNTFAKTHDGKYFIKIGIDNRAYNPIGMYSEGQHNKMLQKIGKKQFNFKKVNKKVYDLYVSFLRTKNLAWLNNADRELL